MSVAFCGFDDQKRAVAISLAPFGRSFDDGACCSIMVFQGGEVWPPAFRAFKRYCLQLLHWQVNANLSNVKPTFCCAGCFATKIRSSASKHLILTEKELLHDFAGT